MTWLYGALNLSDSTRAYVNTVGQRQVWDAVQVYVNNVRMGLQAAQSVFVEETTEDFARRYSLPGGGRMQRRGPMTQTGAVKGYGSWDVQFPLDDFGDQIAVDDVAMAYMSIAEMQRHVETVTIRDVNTRRYQLLKALFNNVARTPVDPIHGSLTVQPLANGDTVVYPPVLGIDTEATEDHYLESGYAASAISDTNNPFATIRDEIEEHFGATQGGSNIVVFINPAQTAKVEALTDFSEVSDRFVQLGSQTDYATNLPAGLPGERVLGRASGTWVVEWRWIPSGYMFGLHLDAPKPLIERVDPADTGLGRGLQLITKDDIYPFEMSHWRDRFGYGVGNRLNGVAFELGTGGTYTIPTTYA